MNVFFLTCLVWNQVLLHIFGTSLPFILLFSLCLNSKQKCRAKERAFSIGAIGKGKNGAVLLNVKILARWVRVRKIITTFHQLNGLSKINTDTYYNYEHDHLII